MQHVHHINKQYSKYSILAILLKLLFFNILPIGVIQLLNLSTEHGLIILNFKNLLTEINLCKSRTILICPNHTTYSQVYRNSHIYSTIYILNLSIKVMYYYFVDSNYFSYIVHIINSIKRGLWCFGRHPVWVVVNGFLFDMLVFISLRVSHNYLWLTCPSPLLSRCPSSPDHENSFWLGHSQTFYTIVRIVALKTLHCIHPMRTGLTHEFAMPIFQICTRVQC